MLAIFYILAVIFCCLLLFLSAELLIGAINRIAKFFGLKEFVVAFFIMAAAASLPNLFVDVSAALRGMPELALGDIIGGNLFDLTIVIALAVFFSRNGIPAKGETIQNSAIFTIASAVLPLVLILDGKLSRVDGLILLSFFIFYINWLFSKKERFTKIYDDKEDLPPLKAFQLFISDLGKAIIGLIFLLVASNLIIEVINKLSLQFNFPMALIGILILGLGNSLPELYFAVTSSRRGESHLLFGDLMGAIIIPATLVLGIVGIISPFSVSNISIYAFARMAMIASALLFLMFIRSSQKISKKEAVVLSMVYILWLLAEVFKNYSA